MILLEQYDSPVVTQIRVKGKDAKANTPAEPQKTIGFVAGGIGDQLYHFTQLEHLAQTAASGRLIWCVCISGRCESSPPVVPDRPDYRCPALPPSPSPASSGGHVQSRRPVAMTGRLFFIAQPHSNWPRSGRDPASCRPQLRHDRSLSVKRFNRFGRGRCTPVWGHRPFIAALDQYFAPTGLSYSGPAPHSLSLNRWRGSKPVMAICPGPDCCESVCRGCVAPMAARSCPEHDKGSFMTGSGHGFSEYRARCP